jgi:glycosyltransferase involved in cell wall biosynthesis
MTAPFFSIIIPAYNRALILPKTIASILKQTFNNYEIIVVDDGSKDNTKEVISELKIENLKYIYQENAERSAARNNGMRNAQGQYICFLDSDDFYLENHLQLLYEEIVKNNFDEALYFVNCNILQNNQITQPKPPALGNDVFKYFLFNSVVPARVCIHSNIFKKFQFHEKIVIVEDTVMWCNIATLFKVHHVQAHTVLYHLHDDNSILIAKNCFLPRLRGLQKMFEQENMKQVINKQVKAAILSDCYFGIARHYEYVKKFWPMLFNVLISIFYNTNAAQSKKKLYMIYAYMLNKPSNNY